MRIFKISSRNKLKFVIPNLLIRLWRDLESIFSGFLPTQEWQRKNARGSGI